MSPDLKAVKSLFVGLLILKHIRHCQAALVQLQQSKGQRHLSRNLCDRPKPRTEPVLTPSRLFQLKVSDRCCNSMEASTALSSPQQSLYRQKFTSLCVLFTCFLDLCMPLYKAARKPATVLACSTTSYTVQQSNTLTSYRQLFTVQQYNKLPVASLRQQVYKTLYKNLCQPVGHACPNQHELMLLLQQTG